MKEASIKITKIGDKEVAGHIANTVTRESRGTGGTRPQHPAYRTPGRQATGLTAREEDLHYGMGSSNKAAGNQARRGRPPTRGRGRGRSAYSTPAGPGLRVLGDMTNTLASTPGKKVLPLLQASGSAVSVAKQHGLDVEEWRLLAKVEESSSEGDEDQEEKEDVMPATKRLRTTHGNDGDEDALACTKDMVVEEEEPPALSDSDDDAEPSTGTPSIKRSRRVEAQNMARAREEERRLRQRQQAEACPPQEEDAVLHCEEDLSAHTQPTQQQDKEGVGRDLFQFKIPTKNNLARKIHETIQHDPAARQRIQRRLAALRDGASEDEEEEDDDEDEEEADEEEAEEETVRRDEHGYLLSDATNYANYFQSLHDTIKNKTSNHTLSKLPRLEPQEITAILNNVTDTNRDARTTLQTCYRRQWPQWYFELSQGFNLLFYGYGSKQNLLNAFTEKACAAEGAVPRLIVKGYHPSASIKDILSKMSLALLPKATSLPSNVFDHAELILDYFQQQAALEQLVATRRQQNRRRRQRRTSHDRVTAAPTTTSTPVQHIPSTSTTTALSTHPSGATTFFRRFYLVIHNIDGTGLRNEKAQAILARLAASPYIRLVASIDHINAFLLWDAAKWTRLACITHDVTTFDPLSAETSFDVTFMTAREGPKTARGVRHVLLSLPSHAQRLFRRLAAHQLDRLDEETLGGTGAADGHPSATKTVKRKGMAQEPPPITLAMPMIRFYQTCRDAFLVSSDLAFRTQLIEFRDHQLILSRHDAEGQAMLYIPMDGRLLRQVVDEMEVA